MPREVELSINKRAFIIQALAEVKGLIVTFLVVSKRLRPRAGRKLTPVGTVMLMIFRSKNTNTKSDSRDNTSTKHYY